ncbi:uncharacterized protein N7496_010754 [Penicillium cataractarum]|uniref:Uncharacterized protein n=1 Tax=Penicillium cataractarum TaxID=2100454 RepID=A0A9W9RDZ8_9EURO|nr:uncharacterized protein N7496_010754 [Penicillium cataractarum]KAJ5358341.1 hypothetical protein N7496_010754 [Penicillium cataractarum]
MISKSPVKYAFIPTGYTDTLEFDIRNTPPGQEATSIFNTFYLKFLRTHLRVTSDKWRPINYLFWVTQPFYKFTTALSKSEDLKIHTVFSFHNRLFDHLENRIRQLQRKKIDQLKGSSGTTTRLLALRVSDNKEDFAAQHKQSLQDRVKRYEKGTYSSLFRAGDIQSAKPTIKIDLLLTHDSRSAVPVSELTQYFKSVLAALARLTLSVPTIDAGVGRLFNPARGICHSRRGSIHRPLFRF